MWKWYNMTCNNVISMLKSNEELGVPAYEIEKRQNMYGENVISTPEIKTLPNSIKNIMLSFWSIMIIINILGMFISGFYFSGFFISVFYSAFIYILIHNSLSNKRKHESFQVLNRYSALVVRDGNHLNIDAGELVIGDIVILEKGRYVPADVRLIKGEGLKVNELAVTGEAYEVEKYDARIVGENIEINKINNMLFKGTVVTEGNGKAIVVAVGDETQIGKIIKEVNKNDNSKSILFTKWSKSMNILYGVSVGFTLIIALINLLRGATINEILESALLGISAVNITPISVIFFGALALYLLEVKKKGIVINRIEALEEFADIDMIFCDKEGVICSKEYTVKTFYTNDQELEVKGSGRIIDRNNLMSDEDYLENSNVIRFLNMLDILNDGVYDKEMNRFSGEDFEIAICKFLKDNYLMDLNNKETKEQCILKIPINNERRVKTIVTKKDDKFIAFSIGTIEHLSNMCTHKFINGIEVAMDDKDIEQMKKKNYDMSKKEMIPYGVAYRVFNYEPSISENIESNMVLSGIIGVINTIESDGYNAIPYFMKNNIRTIVSCKENKIASTVFGKIIGAIKGKETSVLGAEIEFLDKKELDRIVSVCNIYSNMKSYHKVSIAEVLNNMGKNGIYFFNKLADLPLMKYSKVNVSYGNKISNIVKSMSDIIITDNVLNNTVELMSVSKSIIYTFSQLNKYIYLYTSAIYSFIMINLIFNKTTILNPAFAAIVNCIMLPLIILSIALECKDSSNIDKIPKKEIRSINDREKSKYTILGISVGLISTVLVGMLQGFNIVDNDLVSVVLFISLLSLLTFTFAHGNVIFKRFFSNICIMIVIGLIMAIANISYLVDSFGLQGLTGNDVRVCVVVVSLILFIYCFVKYYFNKYIKIKSE